MLRASCQGSVEVEVRSGRKEEGGLSCREEPGQPERSGDGVEGGAVQAT